MDNPETLGIRWLLWKHWLTTGSNNCR